MSSVGEKRTHRLKLLAKHYGIQMLVGFLFLVLAGILAVTVRPRPRAIADPSKYLKPFKPYETVPFSLLIVTCVVIPVILMATYTVVLQRLDLFFAIAAVLLMAFGVCFLVSETLKLTVRRPRPYMGYQIPPGTPGSAELQRRMLEHRLKEGFKSFPSGHTSNGLCGTIALGLFFAGQARPLQSRRARWQTCIMLLMLVVPVGVAIFVAVTRVLDNRHHVTDVLFGAFIGVASSVVSYYANFPFTWSDNPHMPRFVIASGSDEQPRTERTESISKGPSDHPTV